MELEEMVIRRFEQLDGVSIYHVKGKGVMFRMSSKKNFTTYVHTVPFEKIESLVEVLEDILSKENY